MNYLQIVQDLNGEMYDKNQSCEETFTYSSNGFVDAISFGYHDALIWCGENDEHGSDEAELMEIVKVLFNKWIKSMNKHTFDKPYRKSKLVLVYGGVDEFDVLLDLDTEETIFLPLKFVDETIEKIEEVFGVYKNIIVDIDYDTLIDFDKVYKSDYQVLVKGTSEQQIKLEHGTFNTYAESIFPELELPF
jgi:hypothetical protein